MHDGFEITPGVLIAKDDVGEPRPVQIPAGVSMSWPNRATTAASPGEPGATASRASTSASTTGTPASRIRRTT